jgi:hypothetical protein
MRCLIVAFALFLTACSGGEDLAVAERAVSQFHGDLNAGRFGQIHDQAGNEWKNATTKPDAVELFSAVRTKLGAFVSGTQEGWRVNHGTGGTSVVVQYRSRFRNGEGTETFTFRSNRDGAQLIGYNINSNALITG